jgi:DNA-directed RNA polymerase subunit RPC12/RpoP
MADYEPRTRVQDKMICRGCASGRTGSVTVDLSKVAHDSGDPMVIYHCPRCGSGKIIARSDRTTECQFCGTVFTVQVQPEFPGFPQTIDGQDVQVPGMPGNVDGPPAAPGSLDPSGPPGDPNAPVDPNAPIDPAAVGPDGQPLPGGQQGPPDGSQDDQDDSDDDGAGDGPPWAKKSFLTATGAPLTQREYANHVALMFASDKAAVARAIKAAR